MKWGWGCLFSLYGDKFINIFRCYYTVCSFTYKKQTVTTSNGQAQVDNPFFLQPKPRLTVALAVGKQLSQHHIMSLHQEDQLLHSSLSHKAYIYG